MTKNVKWSTEEDNLIITLRSKKKSYKEIMQFIPHRTYNSIRVRGAYLINQGKIESTRSFKISWDLESEQELLRLKIVENLSYKEIAQKLYSTESAISNKLHNLYKKERAYTDNDLLEFVKVYRKPSVMHRAHKEDPLKVPTHLVVLNRFGTWYRASKQIKSKIDVCYLYYVKITNTEGVTYYKIGITKKDIKNRFKQDRDKDIKCLLFTKYLTEEKARKEEKAVLRAFKEYKANDYSFLKSGGNSELFIQDILNLDIDN